LFEATRRVSRRTHREKLRPPTGVLEDSVYAA